MKSKKKTVILLSCILLVAVIGVIIWQVSFNNSWERKFSITYQGYVTEEYLIELDNPYKLYTVKNVTNKTYDSIYAVITVKTWEGDSFNFEKIIHFKLEPQEETSFKIYEKEIKEELSKRNLIPFSYSTEITRIKYK